MAKKSTLAIAFIFLIQHRSSALTLAQGLIYGKKNTSSQNNSSPLPKETH